MVACHNPICLLKKPFDIFSLSFHSAHFLFISQILTEMFMLLFNIRKCLFFPIEYVILIEWIDTSNMKMGLKKPNILSNFKKN